MVDITRYRPDDRSAVEAMQCRCRRAGQGTGAAIGLSHTAAFASHARFQDVLRNAGLEHRPTTLRFVAKVNGCALSADYYPSTDQWHVTRGDPDGDR